MKREYNKKKKGKLTRVGSHFIDEIEDIQKKRLEKSVDRKKKSIKFLTDKIIKHSDWVNIRKDFLKQIFKEEKNE